MIAKNTAERIRQTALELGYFPSAAARSLKTNHSQALGVIICSASFKAEQRHQFLAYGVPIVVVNNQAAEVYHYSIYHDDVDGSRQITRHLLDLGHRRIAYLGNSSSGRTTLDHLTGFQQEMDAARLAVPPEYIHEVSGGGPEDGLAGLENFLALRNRPSALVCFNDMLAIGVLKSLQQAGIQVPNEFSVTGFDNIMFSAFTNPPLTTFDQPKRFIGAEAARLILELLNAPPTEDSSAQSTVVPGSSTGKVRLLKGRLLVRETTTLPTVSLRKP